MAFYLAEVSVFTAMEKKCDDGLDLNMSQLKDFF